MTVKSDAPPVVLDRSIGGVLIGTPMYGGLCHDAYLLGAIDTHKVAADAGVPLSIMTIRNESLIQRARNRIMAEFLASPASHLIFIDADIGFAGRDVMRLIAHNKPLIGATYAKKTRERTDFAFVPMPIGVEVTENHLVEVAALPGGFMCISRDAALRMAGAYRDRKYLPAAAERTGAAWESNLFALFECDICPHTRAYWSEDYLFCQRWRALGEKVWLDPNIVLEHHGTTMFTGDPNTAFQTATEEQRLRVVAGE